MYFDKYAILLIGLYNTLITSAGFYIFILSCDIQKLKVLPYWIQLFVGNSKMNAKFGQASFWKQIFLFRFSIGQRKEFKKIFFLANQLYKLNLRVLPKSHTAFSIVILTWPPAWTKTVYWVLPIIVLLSF